MSILDIIFKSGNATLTTPVSTNLTMAGIGYDKSNIDYVYLDSNGYTHDMFDEFEMMFGEATSVDVDDYDDTRGRTDTTFELEYTAVKGSPNHAFVKACMRADDVCKDINAIDALVDAIGNNTAEENEDLFFYVYTDIIIKSINDTFIKTALAQDDKKIIDVLAANNFYFYDDHVDVARSLNCTKIIKHLQSFVDDTM